MHWGGGGDHVTGLDIEMWVLKVLDVGVLTPMK
jgi:hypothetical protein